MTYRSPIAGLVLAAGRSVRHPGGSKLLLPFNDMTVVRASVRAAAAAGLRPIVVVAGHRAEDVRAAIGEELEKIGSDALKTLEISSMMPFEITAEETDQTPNGKLTPTMVGTASQIADNLNAYKEAGMTMPMLWPPFAGTPTEKTIDDLRQLKEDIMPQVA